MTLACFLLVFEVCGLKGVKRTALWLFGQEFLSYCQQMAVGGRTEGLDYSQYT